MLNLKFRSKEMCSAKILPDLNVIFRQELFTGKSMETFKMFVQINVIKVYEYNGLSVMI